MTKPDRRRPLLPDAWQDAVMGDLEEEARANGHGRWWLGWHLLRAAVRIRWAVLGGAIVTDLRYTGRSLARTPWFTIGAIGTFAVGFGVNLATFSAVDRILFQKAPYDDPGRLVALEACPPGTPTNCAWAALFHLVEVNRQNGMRTLGTIASTGIPARYEAVLAEGPSLTFTTATPNLLRVLNVRPILGRGPTDTEGHDALGLAVLSHETWQHRFGGKPEILGQLVGIAPRLARIIGVLPAGFIPPSAGLINTDWDGLVFKDDASIIEPIARLAPGATVGAAQGEVNALLANLKPGPGGRGPAIVRVVPNETALFQSVSDTAWIIVAVVALLFLMATANLTGLMLARGRSRERDAALRNALGASLTRVVVGTLAESFVVCAVGAVLAWFTLALASNVMLTALPPLFARYAAAPLDLRVLGFTLGAAALTSVAAGLWPAVVVARTDVVTALGQAANTKGASRFLAGRTLVMIEAALGVTVVLVAVLATTSFSILVDQGTGYQTDRLYEISVRRAAPTTPEQSLGMYRQILAAAATTPGVVGVIGEDYSPVSSPYGWAFSNDATQQGARYELTAGGFAALGTRLFAGREFTESEVTADAAVAMLNEPGAALVAPGVPVADLVGRTIPLPGEASRLIVGIVPQLRTRYGEVVGPEIFVPLGTSPRLYLQLLIRLAPGVQPNVELLSQRLSAAVGPLKVNMRAVSDDLDASLVMPRFRTVLFVAIAISGLVLAAAGLYALTAFEVARRTREMGIRLALGATGRQLHWFVASDVLRPVFIGSAAGLVAALWAVRFLRLFLYQLNGHEPGLYILAAAILTVTAGVTAWLPARRAAQTDPASVLRTP